MSAALPGACKVAEDWQRELLQRRTRLDDTLKAGDDARLCSLLLSRLVQSTKIVARLKDVVANFLRND